MSKDLNFKISNDLPEFLRHFPSVEHNWDGSEIYLYHGTNCYRRFEIRTSGEISLGRAGLLFFCTNADRAYDFASVASLRDQGFGYRNSLSHEPILLKVKFDWRHWADIDFVFNLHPNEPMACDLSIAVNKPITAQRIVQVLHCDHSLEFLHDDRALRSAQEDELKQGIRVLRGKATDRKAEIWAARGLERLNQGYSLELSTDDKLRRLRRRSR